MRALHVCVCVLDHVCVCVFDHVFICVFDRVCKRVNACMWICACRERPEQTCFKIYEFFLRDTVSLKGCLKRIAFTQCQFFLYMKETSKQNIERI